MQQTLMQWAIRHGINSHALNDLYKVFNTDGWYLRMPIRGTTEAAVQSSVRVEAARAGIHLFRNNIGVLKNDAGNPVRYGLANDSQQVNKVLKSGDLIGWRTVDITPAHVGTRIAQFVSRECKTVGWKYSGTDHEVAQLNWAQLVASGGGDACFCTGEGTLDGAVTISHNTTPRA